MKTIIINKIQFRGQFGEAIERFNQGEEITMADFNNGKWEATSKVSRFLTLLNLAEIPYKKEGDSLRTLIIKKFNLNEMINSDKCPSNYDLKDFDDDKCCLGNLPICEKCWKEALIIRRTK